MDIQKRFVLTVSFVLAAVLLALVPVLVQSPDASAASGAIVQFNPASYEVNESAGTATITVELSSTMTATVQYATAGNTATAGDDYTETSGILEFTAGEPTKTFDVPILTDSIDEENETVNLTLSAPQNADLGTNASATLTINDDDTAGVQVSTTSINTAEGGANGSYTVVLKSEPTDQVDVTVSPDSQTTVDTTTLTFTPANWDSPQQVTVTAVNDNNVENNPHTSTINHTASSTDPNYDIDPGPNVTVSITDNDMAGITVSSPNVSATEGGTDGTYTVRLDSRPTAEVTISFVTDDQVTVSPSPLTFAPGEWNTPKAVTVTAVDDNVVENNPHTSTINHTASSDDTNYDIGSGANPNVTVNITDNDTAGVTLSSTIDSATEGGPTGSYTIKLNSQPTANVTINLDTDDQVSVSPSPLTFAPGEWNTPKTVTVSAVDDNVDEANSHFGSIVHTAQSTDGNYNGTAVDDVTVNVTDNDTAEIVLNRATSSLSEGFQDFDLYIQLTQPAAFAIEVDYATSDGAAKAGDDYQTTTGTATFAAGQTSKHIKVPIIHDDIDEPNESFSLQLSSPQGATLGSPNSVQLTINDNDDTPRVSFARGSYSEEEDAGTVTVDVELSNPSSQQITVNVSASGSATPGSDYSLSSNTIIIPAGETEGALEVTVHDDNVDESDEQIMLKLTSPQNAQLGSLSSTTFTIADNDNEPQILFNSNPNDILVDNNYQVREDSGTATITLTLSAPSGKTVTVNYTTVDDSATAGDDYETESGTLTFGPNQMRKTFNVPILDDPLDENDERVVLHLSNASNATVGSNAPAILYIRDNDGPPEVGFVDSTYFEFESEGSKDIAVDLSHFSGKTVQVDYETSNGSAKAGSDYTATSGTLLFDGASAGKKFTIPINNDSLEEEASETVTLTLSNPVNAELSSSFSTATLYILDDDGPPTVGFGRPTFQVDEGAGEATVEVTLDHASVNAVSIDYETANGSAFADDDYTSVSGTLTFNPGQVRKTFKLPVLEDVKVEQDETVLLTLSNPSNVKLGSSSSATLLIADNDYASYLSVLPKRTPGPPPPLTNGGFENGWNPWSHGGQLKQSLTTADPHSGGTAALLGDPGIGSGTGGNVPAGSGWVEQEVEVPFSTSPTLSLWYRYVSYDVLRGSSGTLWDSIDVTVNGALVHRDGSPRSSPGTQYDSGWKQAVINLSAYRGQTVRIRIAVWNREYDGSGQDFFNTWARVDDVAVLK